MVAIGSQEQEEEQEAANRWAMPIANSHIPLVPVGIGHGQCQSWAMVFRNGNINWAIVMAANCQFASLCRENNGH